MSFKDHSMMAIKGNSPEGTHKNFKGPMSHDRMLSSQDKNKNKWKSVRFYIHPVSTLKIDIYLFHNLRWQKCWSEQSACDVLVRCS